ncbi:MAG: ABC transporter permease [Clostridiales bacterium]|jgi:sulfonate transport system permease protein|nr:ABC transporter permease [Clostridiales bacterium]
MVDFKRMAIGLILPFIALALWFIATTWGGAPAGILPSIKSVGAAFKLSVESGQLFRDIGISLLRVAKGYAAAAILGLTLGSLMGMFPVCDAFFAPTAHTLRQIPIMAWIPLIILWCGIGETSKVVIIIFGAFFPIMLNAMSGITSTSKGYIEVAKMYQMSKWRVFCKVYLPSALPQIFVGLRLGLGISWMALVAAEIVASTKGIGFRISDARSLLKPDVVIMGMIVIGAIGVTMDKVLVVIAKKATPWTVKGAER